MAGKAMATKAKATQVKEEVPEKDAEGATESPLPLLDLSDAAVKKMIKAAKKRGFVTYAELNAVLPEPGQQRFIILYHLPDLPHECLTESRVPVGALESALPE